MSSMLMSQSGSLDPALQNRIGKETNLIEVYRATEKEEYLTLGGNNSLLKHLVTTNEVNIATTCGRFGLQAGEYLFCVAIWVPDDSRDEFFDWYRIEHFPMLVECETWDGGRLVERRANDGHQFYALHNLTSPNALDSEERINSRSTDWFKKLAENDWFDGAFVRTLYRRFPF